ncbi:TetR/AcrR family transcriptional regulator [Paenibacillus sp. CGMCC 1.16610]|uniref:TetR family transcriptional regulator n=2 Tax=Paenibacillus TaxID=44249 RepID=A0ABW9UJC8_9BACL|nr:TetR/AcrR family transcriptional regulator [Paenibacillus sp. CGMCC 1.16610]MVQ38773.1 TetR family transcriptional regulator [Paenibacillus anseongense]
MSTSLSEIMAVTGLKKGTLYNHFKDKEELVSLAFEYCLTIFEQYIQNAISVHTSSKDRVLAFIDAYCSFDDSTLPGGCPIINVAVEVYDGLSELLQNQARYGMSYITNVLVDILEKGVQEGEFKRDIDTNQVASIMISSCEGGLLMNKLRQEQSHSRFIYEHLSAFVEREICV